MYQYLFFSLDLLLVNVKIQELITKELDNFAKILISTLLVYFNPHQCIINLALPVFEIWG